MNLPAFEPLADDALLLRFGDAIDAADNARALRLAGLLHEQNFPWLRDLVPAYASLAVFFDADRIEAPDAHAFVAATLTANLRSVASASATAIASRVIGIPVCYESDMAPDLAEAADTLGISVETLIERHSTAAYTVAMIGFAPGFPYLLGLPESLALPRLGTPRTRVPAGSVAIGGSQAGIYPRESPGGWRLIGRTPLSLFDPACAAPSLLMPGDGVKFHRIDRATFLRLQSP